MVQLNPVPVFGAQKKYQYHLTEIFRRYFRTNGKRSWSKVIFLKIIYFPEPRHSTQILPIMHVDLLERSLAMARNLVRKSCLHSKRFRLLPVVKSSQNYSQWWCNLYAKCATLLHLYNWWFVFRFTLLLQHFITSVTSTSEWVSLSYFCLFPFWFDYLIASGEL